MKKLLADILRMFGAYKWADKLDPPNKNVSTGGGGGGPIEPP